MEGSPLPQQYRESGLSCPLELYAVTRQSIDHRSRLARESKALDEMIEAACFGDSED